MAYVSKITLFLLLIVIPVLLGLKCYDESTRLVTCPKDTDACMIVKCKIYNIKLYEIIFEFKI